MKKSILFFVLLISLSGCGYRVADIPKLSVYVAPVENRLNNRATLGILVERAVENRLQQRGMTLADSPVGADVVIQLQLSGNGRRTLQSGIDNRMTASREMVSLKAVFQKKSGEWTMRRQFPLITQSPTQSRFYYNESGREERELAGQMALQVAAWLTKP